jgi:hypothetical protein
MRELVHSRPSDAATDRGDVAPVSIGRHIGESARRENDVRISEPIVTGDFEDLPLRRGRPRRGRA